jgi:hypothetical protein
MNIVKKKIIKKKLKILDQIENIRKKNNTKWMDLCRLAITLDHKKSSKIISEINKYDTQINTLVKKLTK